MSTKNKTDSRTTTGTDDNRKALLATARELADLGFNLVAIGRDKVPAVPAGYLERPLQEVTSDALEKVRTGGCAGLGVVCNSRSILTLDGETFVVTALELEGKAMTDQFLADWAEAAERLALTATLERLDVGWKESTPSGGVRWFFAVPVPDAEHADWALKNVPQKSATRAGETYAELLVNKHSVIVAPSFGPTHPTGLPWELVTGGPNSLPRLSVSDLHSLSALLSEVGDAPTVPTSAIEIVDGRTREVMAAYIRKATDGETVEALTQAGWRVTSTDAKAGTVLERISNPGHGSVSVGGASRPDGSLWTFSTSAKPFEAETFYSAFEVLAMLKTGGDLATFAEDLLETGVVRLFPWPLMSRVRPDVFPDQARTDVLAATISRALVEAKHPTQPGIPFALSEVDAQGNSVSVLSMTRDGSIRRWAHKDYAALACAVVQPARRLQSGDVVYEHTLAPGVVKAVFSDGAGPTSLHAVRHVSDGPILLPTGRVVQEPGYHPKDRAFVAIPRRDQAFWATYVVRDRPSQADAQRALDFVRTELLSDFPWEFVADEARYIAYLLTCASRDTYPTAPGFLFDAADRGTGKSKAAAIGRRIGFGTFKAQSATYDTKGDVELEKALVSAVLAGIKALHVDELPRGQQVTSRVVSELLTNDGSMTQRVLGGNTSIAIPALVFSVCGCNAELGGDSNRRFVPIRMVHKGSNLAFERTGFRHPDLTSWVVLNRPRLLAALHTILLFGMQNPTAPSDLPKGFGSFEDWVKVVLGALHHVTLDGVRGSDLVAEGRAEFIDSQDEEGDDWAPFMAAWVRTFDSEQWVKAAAAHSKMTNLSPSLELPAELMPQFDQGASGAVKTWGRALLRRRDTAVRVDGVVYRIAAKTDAKRGNSYRVVVARDTRATASDEAAEVFSAAASLPPVPATPRAATTAPVAPPSRRGPSADHVVLEVSR